VAGETERESERWKVKLIVFVGGACGSVHVQTFNNNLKELGVVESKRGAIRKRLVHELLYAQDTVLCSYFAQREGATNGDRGRRNTVAEVFQGQGEERVKRSVNPIPNPDPNPTQAPQMSLKEA